MNDEEEYQVCFNVGDLFYIDKGAFLWHTHANEIVQPSDKKPKLLDCNDIVIIIESSESCIKRGITEAHVFSKEGCGWVTHHRLKKI